MTREEWTNKLLTLDITAITSEQANQLVIDYYRWFVDQPDVMEARDPAIDHVLYQLDELSNKLIPEDD